MSFPPPKSLPLLSLVVVAKTAARSKNCSVENCDDPILARGLCRRHYLQKYRVDDRPPLKPKGPPLEYMKISFTREHTVKLKRRAKTSNMRASEFARNIVQAYLDALDEQEKAGAVSASP